MAGTGLLQDDLYLPHIDACHKVNNEGVRAERMKNKEVRAPFGFFT